MLAPVVSGLRMDSLLRKYTYFRSTFTKQLEAIFDNLPEESRRFRLVASRIRKFYDWESRADAWIECFELVDGACASVTAKSKVIRRLVSYIQNKNQCSKAEILRYLNWHPKSRHIPWSRYRKFLRTRFHEDAASATVTFQGRLRPSLREQAKHCQIERGTKTRQLKSFGLN
jgi:hypothetical protein